MKSTQTIPRSTKFLLKFALVLLALSLAPAPSPAISIRDDRTEADYAQLRSLEGTGAVVSIISYFQTPFNSSPQAYRGSGVHIGNGVILTAGHVPNLSGGTWIGSLIETRSGGSWSVEGSNKRTHPSFKPDNYGGTYQFDLSMLWVGSESVWGGVGTNGLEKLPSVALWGDTPTLGDEVYMAGWGRRGTGSNPASISAGQFRVGMNTLDARTFNGAVGQIDFDSHLGTTQNLGSSTPLNLEAMIAPGDSGGGWLKLDNGKLALTHINSGVWGTQDGRSDGGYTDLGLGISVSHYMPWIQEQARSLGAIGQGQSLLTVGTTILPLAPSGLSYQSVTDSRVQIAWAPVQGSQSYAVYRNGTLLSIVMSNNYADLNLLESTLYEYQVAARNLAGEGPKSSLSARTLSFSEANPRSIRVNSPSAPSEHRSLRMVFSGQSGSELMSGMSWTNKNSGATGTFVASSGFWSAEVSLSPGTNSIEFWGFYEDGPVTSLASDNGSSAVYGDGWTSGDNGGTGFSPWEIQAQSGGEALRRPADSSPTSIAFTLWSTESPTSRASAQRSFAPMGDEDQISLDFRLAASSTSGRSGVDFVDENGNTALTIQIPSTGQLGKISDASGDKTISWTNQGALTTLAMSTPSSGSYQLKIGSAVFSGISKTSSRITSIRLFSETASPAPSLLMEERLNYTAPVALAGLAGGTGFSGAWVGGDSVLSQGTQSTPAWLRIGTTASTRRLASETTTGTSPVYFSFIMRSPSFTSANYSGVALSHSSNPGDDRMFFGIPWIQGKFGFDVRAGRWPLDVQTVSGLEANRPYLVLCALVPGSVPGKVDVKMWVSSDTTESPLSLLRRPPSAVLEGENGRPNFSFDTIRVSGDNLGALEVTSLRRLSVSATEPYELRVSSLKVENLDYEEFPVKVLAPEVVVPLDELSDYDENGLSDLWELRYFGTTGIPADNDADTDGFSNRQELLLGTSPVDISSKFEIRVFEPAEGGGVIIAWTSVPGKKYRVMTRPALGEGSWMDASGPLSALSQISEFRHTPPSSLDNIFYTVELIPEASPQTVPVSLLQRSDVSPLSEESPRPTPTPSPSVMQPPATSQGESASSSSPSNLVEKLTGDDSPREEAVLIARDENPEQIQPPIKPSFPESGDSAKKASSESSGVSFVELAGEGSKQVKVSKESSAGKYVDISSGSSTDQDSAPPDSSTYSVASTPNTQTPQKSSMGSGDAEASKTEGRALSGGIPPSDWSSSLGQTFRKISNPPTPPASHQSVEPYSPMVNAHPESRLAPVSNNASPTQPKKVGSPKANHIAETSSSWWQGWWNWLLSFFGLA